MHQTPVVILYLQLLHQQAAAVVEVLTRLHATAAQAAARFTLLHLLHLEQAQPIKDMRAAMAFLQQVAAGEAVRYNLAKQRLRLKQVMAAMA
jgi:hypothetical protein